MAWGINNLNLICLAVYAGAALVVYHHSGTIGNPINSGAVGL
jgi:hypothetical protein